MDTDVNFWISAIQKKQSLNAIEDLTHLFIVCMYSWFPKVSKMPDIKWEKAQKLNEYIDSFHQSLIENELYLSQELLKKLASIYAKAAEYKYIVEFSLHEALELSMREERILRAIVKRSDMSIANCMGRVAQIYASLGKPHEGLNYLNKALCLIPEYSSVHQQKIQAGLLHGMGLSYRTLGKADVALEYFEKALAIRQKVSKGKHKVEIAESYRDMALSHRDLGNGQVGKNYCQLSLDILNALISDKYHPDYATTLNNLAICLRCVHQPYQARELDINALKIQKRLFGECHPSIATSLRGLGISHRLMGNHKIALQYHEKAVLMRQKLWGKSHPDLADSLNDMGVAYLHLNDNLKAMEYFEKSYLMFYEFFPKDHPRIKVVYKNFKIAVLKSSNEKTRYCTDE